MKAIGFFEHNTQTEDHIDELPTHSLFSDTKESSLGSTRRRPHPISSQSIHR